MFRSLLTYFRNLTKIEKITAVLVFMLVVLSFVQLVWRFYEENSTVYPDYGGEYKEGLVGKVQYLNPLLAFAKNNPDEDISRLVFSGLMKYNPATRQIENDIALHTLSVDKLVYTFTLRENVFWHDGTVVTADDIVYTYKDVIQSEQFSDLVIKDAFKDVTIEKIDDRTATFTLKKPYKFFIANLTLGLLPKHILEIVPVENLALSEFNLAPIGTGPYQFQSLMPEEGTSVVHLSTFDDYYGTKPFITNLDFRIYATGEDLWQHLNDVNGFRILDNNRQAVELMGKYKIYDYELFQYVALFLNTKSSVLSNPKLRLGLQLATNKQEIVDGIGGGEIIDTPLLEITNDNWVYQFDPERAAGAFVDTEWKIPGKSYTGSGTAAVAKKVTAEEVNTEGTEPVTYLNGPNEGKDWETDSESFYLTGTNPSSLKKLYVNDYQLQLFNPEKGSFSFFASAKIGTLREGVNVFRVYGEDESGEKKEFDAIKIIYTPKVEEVVADPDDGYIRENSRGEKLRLKLLTKSMPGVYQQVAENIRTQWRKVGVDVNISVLEGKEFDDAVLKRDYDILLYGQNLGYNLDAYTYWHSSQAGENGVNLSEYTSFAADALFEEIRATHDEEKRQAALTKLQDILSADTPAIFLYSPSYSYAIENTLRSVAVNNLALHSDRLNAIQDWFVKQRYAFRDDASWFNFISWVWSKM